MYTLKKSVNMHKFIKSFHPQFARIFTFEFFRSWFCSFNAFSLRNSLQAGNEGHNTRWHVLRSAFLLKVLIDKIMYFSRGYCILHSYLMHVLSISFLICFCIRIKKPYVLLLFQYLKIFLKGNFIALLE